LGENFVYPTATIKARKYRETHESSALDRRRDINRITTNSNKEAHQHLHHSLQREEEH
jgi:hypothetical protein